MALAAAEQSVRFILPGSAEYGEAKARVTLLHNGLRLMRGGLGVPTKRHDLGELLVEICRERSRTNRMATHCRRSATAVRRPRKLKNGSARLADFDPIQARPVEDNQGHRLQRSGRFSFHNRLHKFRARRIDAGSRSVIRWCDPIYTECTESMTSKSVPHNPQTPPTPRLKQLAFAFPFLRKAQGNARPSAQFTDEHDIYRLLAASEPSGAYLVSRKGMWHGGVHITEAGAGQALDLDAGLRCIADGVLIAYRANKDYPVSELAMEGGNAPFQAPYSTGFALVRHEMEFPRDSKLTFYSLYMHLMSNADYDSNFPKRQKPAYWSRQWQVTQYAQDRPSPRAGQTVDPAQVGLHVRKTPNGSVLGILPQGASVSISKTATVQGAAWGQVTDLNGATLYPPEAGGYVAPSVAINGWIYLGAQNGGPVAKESIPDSTFDRIVVAMNQTCSPGDPQGTGGGISVKAGDLIGHLGRYDSLNQGTSGTRMAHIEVFCDDSIQSFLKQGRLWVNQHGPHKEDWAALGLPYEPTILRIAPGTVLYQRTPDNKFVPGADPQSRKTDAVQVYSLAELARDSNRRIPEPHPHPDPGYPVNWWHVDGVNAQGQPVDGWVCDFNHPSGRVTPEFAQKWIDFECLSDAHDPAHTIFATTQQWVDYASGANVADLASRSNLSPLMLKVYDALFRKGDGRQAADELCTLSQTERGGYPWLMQAASRLIVKHESEWANPSKWKQMIAELEKQTGPKSKHEEEQKRIDKLVWWDEVKARVPGFPAPEVFHIHPIALRANFASMFQFTLSMLQHIFANASANTLQEVVDELNAHITLYRLDNALRREHFFAQVKQETGSALLLHNESLNYAAEALTTGTFSYFLKHPEEAKEYGRTKDHPANEEAIANRVYAGQDCNGEPESGDGCRYRGRGMIQLTHRGGYQRFTKWHKANADAWPQEATADFEAEPESVGQVKYAVRSACFFWVAHSLYGLADQGDTQDVVDSVSKVINPGLFKGKPNNMKTESIGGRRGNFAEIHQWGGLV
ncbi:glycoside hydrolase family 19 protein [Paraburkholderia sp. CI3]|uniref:glycoside hydrolase family 19 protein n=1 Tax=Paraburkholderia sp. CI3 TaxID=2991060 RepID=UPI003D1C6F88